MTLMRHFAELVRALAVLALVFLSYAHAPLASTSAGPAWSALSFCGDPVDGGDDRPCAVPCLPNRRRCRPAAPMRAYPRDPVGGHG